MIKIYLKSLATALILLAVSGQASAELIYFNFFADQQPNQAAGYIAYDSSIFDNQVNNLVSGNVNYNNSNIVDLYFNIGGLSNTINEVYLNGQIAVELLGSTVYDLTIKSGNGNEFSDDFAFDARWGLIDSSWNFYSGHWLVSDVPNGNNNDVPVPATALLFAAGLLGFSIRRKTK